MAIEKSFSYKCLCERSSHSWTTKTAVVPDRCAKCNAKTWNEGAPAIIEKSLADRVRELDTDRRLDLFSKFETCCGQDSGNCVCEPVEIAPVEIRSDKLSIDELRNLIAPIENVPLAPVTVSEDLWKFTSDGPEFPDSGGVYRRQYLVSNPKKRRSVRVDEDDHDRIIE